MYMKSIYKLHEKCQQIQRENERFVARYSIHPNQNVVHLLTFFSLPQIALYKEADQTPTEGRGPAQVSPGPVQRQLEDSESQCQGPTSAQEEQNNQQIRIRSQHTIRNTHTKHILNCAN